MKEGGKTGGRKVKGRREGGREKVVECEKQPEVLRTPTSTKPPAATHLNRNSDTGKMQKVSDTDLCPFESQSSHLC